MARLHFLNHILLSKGVKFSSKPIWRNLQNQLCGGSNDLPRVLFQRIITPFKQIT